VSTEYLQFAGAMVLMLGILIGSYWFVYTPNRGRLDSDDDRDRTQQ
jgi:cbb3-type cytochrome oxidase subunit 3